MPPVPTGRLAPEQLFRRCAGESVTFATTDDVADVADIVGQPRAVEAIGFGIGIREDGYNLFAMGPEGVGRRTLAKRFLDRAAGDSPVPRDWCYVFASTPRIGRGRSRCRRGGGRRSGGTWSGSSRTCAPASPPRSRPTSTARASRRS